MARLHAEAPFEIEEEHVNPTALDGNWHENLFYALKAMIYGDDVRQIRSAVDQWLLENPDAQRALMTSDRDLRFYFQSLPPALATTLIEVLGSYR